MDCQLNDCSTQGSEMTHCGAYLIPHQVCSDTESLVDTVEMINPPPPLRLQRQNVEPRLSKRLQDLQFIEENGLIEFCKGKINMEILQDIYYLRAQIVYLSNM
jgi:hypothetical protein